MGNQMLTLDGLKEQTSIDSYPRHKLTTHRNAAHDISTAMAWFRSFNNRSTATAFARAVSAMV
jgi:hypothetical protein